MDTPSKVVILDSPKEMKAAISRMLRQIDEIREQMKADGAEIAKIRAESAVLSAESRVMRDETEKHPHTIAGNLVTPNFCRLSPP